MQIYSDDLCIKIIKNLCVYNKVKVPPKLPHTIVHFFVDLDNCSYNISLIFIKSLKIILKNVPLCRVNEILLLYLYFT